MIKILLISALLFTSCTSLPLTKWPKSEITYSIDAIHLEGIGLIKANEVIHKAFKAWEVTGIKFRHVMHGQIKVVTEPMKGRRAGYGYFPPPRGDGVLQLDSSDRTWSESFLYQVTLHEIGHCLGLEHSKNRSSVMFYKIRGLDKLSHWDIEHIQLLYELEKKGKE